MPKLRVFSARQVCDILQEHGFTKSRQSGSHIVMRYSKLTAGES